MLAGKIIRVSCLYWDGTQWRGWYYLFGDPALAPGSFLLLGLPLGAYAIYVVSWKNTGDTPLRWDMSLTMTRPDASALGLVKRGKNVEVVQPTGEGVMQFGAWDGGGIWMDQKGSYQGALVLTGEAA